MLSASSAPPAALRAATRRPQRRFVRLVLLGVVLELAAAALGGFLGLLEVALFGAGPGPSWLSDLFYLEIPAAFLSGFGGFLVLYGVALGIRESLSHIAPSRGGEGLETQGLGASTGPTLPEPWWKRSPFRFALVGAILVLVGFVVDFSVLTLRFLQVYSPVTAGSFTAYIQLTTSVTVVTGVVQVLGAVLANLGIVATLDRTADLTH
ncbi:MAG TPA: hypothetical protein VEY12_04420 [Thermoplasmata archaeon]|nr:hypothetical protein [Thermoplasmata archaeon]